VSVGKAQIARRGAWLRPVLGRKSSIPHASFLAKKGDRYLVWESGFGEFRNRGNQIAEWNGSEWLFTEPTNGDAVLVEEEDTVYIYGGSKRRWIVHGNSASKSKMLNVNNQTMTINSASSVTTSGDVETFTITNCNCLKVESPPKRQMEVGDLVWHKITKRGPFVLIAKQETDFYREVSASSGRRDSVSLSSIRVDSTWVVLDRRGRLSSIPEAALTDQEPSRMVSKVALTTIMLVFFPVTIGIWLLSWRRSRSSSTWI